MKHDDTEKQKKAGNPLFILIIFVFLIGFVFLVPEVYRKFNTNIADFLGVGIDKNKDKVEEEEDDEKGLSDYYQIGSNGTLKFNDIALSDISLNDHILTFTISSDKVTDLDELHYYLEFYEEKRVYVGRRSITGKLDNSKTMSIDVSNLKVTTTTYMVISHIDDAGIKPIEMNTDESGIGTLTCQRGDYSYDYEFNLGKLLKVTMKYNYMNNNLNEYSDKLLEYKKLEKNYNEYNEVTATIVENANNFIFTSEFDYSEIKSFNRIDNHYLFEKDALNNVVKFKMNAEGFDCE